MPVCHLLSIYDELLIGYGNHRWSADAGVSDKLRAVAGSLTQVIVLNGLAIGRWRKTESRGGVQVSCDLHRTLSPREHATLDAAVADFRAFHQES